MLFAMATKKKAAKRTARSTSSSQFGALLKTHRQKAGLAQTDVAAGAGVSGAFIGMLESGKRNASKDVTDALIIALDLKGAKAAELRRAAGS